MEMPEPVKAKKKKKPFHPWRIFEPNMFSRDKKDYPEPGKYYKGLSKTNRAR